MRTPLVFFNGDKTVNKSEIESILPHTGRMLLLDGIDITKERVLGSFRVTYKVCEGHRVLDGKEVLKGSDLFDMASQLLAVGWAVGHPNEGETCMPRRYREAKLKKPIMPGEILSLEIKIKNITAESIDRKEGGRTIFLTGEKFLAKVGKETKAEIMGVHLVIL